MRSGHVIGLDLGKGPTDAPAVTIDGVPVKYVSDIKVDAPARGVMTVTMTFLARAITGIASQEETNDE